MTMNYYQLFLVFHQKLNSCTRDKIARARVYTARAKRYAAQHQLLWSIFSGDEALRLKQSALIRSFQSNPYDATTKI